MAELLFGTAGIPHSSKKKDSAGGIEQIRKLGLGAMELEFVYGVKMKKEAAEKTKEAAEKNNVRLSVHAPYYINLNAKEKSKIGLSKHNILESCRIGSLAGAEIVLFHPGFYLGMPKEETIKNISENLSIIVDELEAESIPIRLGLETTGKHSAFGSLEENVELAKQLKNVYPVIDFSHLHARCNGCLKKEEDFASLLKKIPSKFLSNLHMHISGINYSEKGERNHMNFEEKGNTFDFKPLLKALKKADVSGTAICESPCLEDDAILMKNFWASL